MINKLEEIKKVLYDAVLLPEQKEKNDINVITTNAESGALVREESGSLPIMNLYISELSSFGGWACRPGGAFNCS